ncbi:hypothetical protein BDR06DRAFT_970842 [Suillus hirtellus]|nr:hypothetical protein BDR06DRAFT_970842 [Suillus hirtellus]
MTPLLIKPLLPTHNDNESLEDMLDIINNVAEQWKLTDAISPTYNTAIIDNVAEQRKLMNAISPTYNTTINFWSLHPYKDDHDMIECQSFSATESPKMLKEYILSSLAFISASLQNQQTYYIAKMPDVTINDFNMFMTTPLDEAGYEFNHMSLFHEKFYDPSVVQEIQQFIQGPDLARSEGNLRVLWMILQSLSKITITWNVIGPEEQVSIFRDD